MHTAKCGYFYKDVFLERTRVKNEISDRHMGLRYIQIMYISPKKRMASNKLHKVHFRNFKGILESANILRPRFKAWNS